MPVLSARLLLSLSQAFTLGLCLLVTQSPWPSWWPHQRSCGFSSMPVQIRILSLLSELLSCFPPSHTDALGCFGCTGLAAIREYQSLKTLFVNFRMVNARLIVFFL